MAMPTKGTVIQFLGKEGDYLAREFGVQRIGLFGSSAEGRPTEASDVDLVVELDRTLHIG